MDLQWCPDGSDPWLLASLSDDSTNRRLGGGTLQVWRILDLVFGLKDDEIKRLDTADTTSQAPPASP